MCGALIDPNQHNNAPKGRLQVSCGAEGKGGGGLVVNMPKGKISQK